MHNFPSDNPRAKNPQPEPNVSSSQTSTVSATNVFMDPNSSEAESFAENPNLPSNLNASDANQNARIPVKEEPKNLFKKFRVHLLKKPDLSKPLAFKQESGLKKEDLLIKEEFEDPGICFKQWESKTKNPEHISGHSKKSAVLFGLIKNQVGFRVKKDYKKLMLNFTEKYKEHGVPLDYTFKSNLVQTCVDFTKRLKKKNPAKKVFMRPLFIAVAYCLLKAECKDNDFLVELRDIMDFVNPENSKKFKTKMVLFYLNEFKDIYRCEDFKREDHSELSKRSYDEMQNENSESVLRNQETSLTDERKIKQIFKIISVVFRKLSKDNRQFQAAQNEVNSWARKIFYFRESLIQTLLCKKVKNVGLALLFLGLIIVFPQQEMNLTDYLEEINKPDKKKDAQSGNIIKVLNINVYYL